MNIILLGHTSSDKIIWVHSDPFFIKMNIMITTFPNISIGVKMKKTAPLNTYLVIKIFLMEVSK